MFSSFSKIAVVQVLFSQYVDLAHKVNINPGIRDDILLEFNAPLGIPIPIPKPIAILLSRY